MHAAFCLRIVKLLIKTEENFVAFHNLGKDKICELLKDKLNNRGIIFAEIWNNTLILKDGEKIPLNQFNVEIYEYE